MKSSPLCFVLAFSALLLSVSAQNERPLVTRPESTRAYTTTLTLDGGAFRCIISSMVCIEVEDSIKRYLLDHPEYLPEDANITTIDDFDVLLADFFDAISGVSAGSWMSAYLASKGGNGAAEAAFSSRNINRRYGNIVPGGARGLEVFFVEYGESFYPETPAFNITPPTVSPDMIASANVSTLLNPTSLGALLPDVSIPGVNEPFYPVNGLEQTLELFLGDVTLADMSTFYVVHAYDLIRRQNIYYVHDTTPRGDSVTYTAHGRTRNRPRDFPEGDEDYEGDLNIENLDFLVRDIVRGSSALPGFHEAKAMSPVGDDAIRYNLIDGSLISNNAAMQTFLFLSSAPRRIPVTEIALMSIGSGIPLDDYSDNVDASVLGWLLNNELLVILTDGSSENVQAQVDFLFYGTPGVLPGQYIRIQTSASVDTEEGAALTEPPTTEVFPTLRQMGLDVAETYRDAIDNFVADFIFAE